MFKIALTLVLGLFGASTSFAVESLYNCVNGQGTKLHISSMQGRSPIPYLTAALVAANGEVVYLSQTKSAPPADYTFKDAQGQIATVQLSTSSWANACGRCDQPTPGSSTKAKLVYLNQTSLFTCN